MADVPLRIGIWFNSSHIAYGGPSLVLIGTLIGFLRQPNPPIILLNERGDVNWFVDTTTDFESAIANAPNAYIGPMALTNGDAETEDYTQHPLWKHGTHFIAPSDWYRWWIQRGLPFHEKEKAEHRTCDVWGAGVDTEFFSPSAKKTQDFFIYFKSQNYGNLQLLHQFLFHNYFHFRGSVLVYYHYDKDMLKQAATSSRFCIMLDGTETQGLASLEIMACDCPLFVLDCKKHTGKRISMDGASSVPCMDSRCGMKSSLETIQNELPVFLKRLEGYRPRQYVCETYSFEAAAQNLIKLLKVSS